MTPQVRADNLRSGLTDLSIIVTFGALPLASSLVIDVGFPLTVSHVFVGVLAIVSFVPMLRHRRVRTWLPVVAFGAFWLAYAISMVVHLGVDYGSLPWATGRQSPDVRSVTKVFWLAGNIAIALVIANALDCERRLRLACRWMVVGAAVSAAYGVYQVIGFAHGFYVPLLPGTEFVTGTASFWIVPRAQGTFLEPSFFGAFLASVLPFAVGAAAARRPWVISWPWSFVVVIVLVGGEVATFSIGGWVPAFIGVAVLGVVVGRQGIARVLRVSATAAAIVGLFTILLLPNALAAFETLATKGVIAVDIVLPLPSAAGPGATARPTPSLPPEFGTRSATERVASTRAALGMFADQPLLGVGPGNYPFLFDQYRPSGSEPARSVLIANNIYAEVLAESGIVGTTLFVAGGMAIWIRTLKRTRGARGGQTIVAQCGLAAVTAIAANLLTGPSFTILYQWVLIGLLAAAIVDRTGQDATPLREAPRRSGGVA